MLEIITPLPTVLIVILTITILIIVEFFALPENYKNIFHRIILSHGTIIF
jgi:hypothetical protein